MATILIIEPWIPFSFWSIKSTILRCWPLISQGYLNRVDSGWFRETIFKFLYKRINCEKILWSEETETQKEEKSNGIKLLICFKIFYINQFALGMPGWLSGKCLPSAQDMILESQDQALHRAPCMEPASPSAYVSGSLSFSWMNNKISKKIHNPRVRLYHHHRVPPYPLPSNGCEQGPKQVK